MSGGGLLIRKVNIGLFVAVLALTLLYVRLRINVYHLSYNLDSNMKAFHELAEKNKKLKVEVASLRSPARLGQLAGEKLNMSLNNNGKAIMVGTR